MPENILEKDAALRNNNVASQRQLLALQITEISLKSIFRHWELIYLPEVPFSAPARWSSKRQKIKLHIRGIVTPYIVFAKTKCLLKYRFAFQPKGNEEHERAKYISPFQQM